MSKNYRIFLLVPLFIIYSSCKDEPVSSFDLETGKVIDIDGNSYNIVNIGNQVWMAENLRVTHYRNGESIPVVSGAIDWTKLSIGACCHYANEDNNTEIYGLMYNWFAVDDPRILAPEGWHIPTDDEFKELEMYLGINESDASAIEWRGEDEGGKLKVVGTAFWKSPNEGATNESGFAALPGGYRSYIEGEFFVLTEGAYWWTSTSATTTRAWDRSLYHSNSQVFRYHWEKRNGFSIRCVKD